MDLELPDAEGEVRRFVDTFREAWGRLPEGVRLALRAHWGPPEGEMPEIRLVPSLGGTMSGGPAAATCSRGGYELEFWGPGVIPSSVSALACTVAHELAHAYRYAAGQADPGMGLGEAVREGGDSRAVIAEFSRREEEAVQALLLQWGFSRPTGQDRIRQDVPPSGNEATRRRAARGEKRGRPTP